MTDRFRWLHGDSQPGVAPWDIDLTPSRRFATVPSRGAIVEGWLLTLPRKKVINIAARPLNERRSLIAQAFDTAQIVGNPERQTTFFEHGPVETGTPTGCGLDHAHLHSVPLAFDLLAELPIEMGWQRVDPSDPWRTLGDRDYLVVGRNDNWMACEPEVPVSQFFRRQIAISSTGGYGWDHNYHFWPENVRRTVDLFASS